MPLDAEARRRGQQKSLEVRRQKAADRKAKAEVIRRVVSETDDLAPAAFRTVLTIVDQVEQGIFDIEVNNALDAHRLASTAEILHRIGRLATGQSTSNVAHAQAMSEEERRERMAYLQSRLRAFADQEGDQDAV